MGALASAKRLMAKGFNVIPLVAGDKRPRAEWLRWQEERCPLDAFRDDDNIGIVCGRTSMIAVVDADSAEAVAWCDANLPHTPLRVKTSKGVHYYYRHVDGVGNAAGVRERVDVRGQGGYVVAPPSLHPSGTTYAWDADDGLQLATTLQLPEYPASLLATGDVVVTPTGDLRAAKKAPFGMRSGSRHATMAKWAGTLRWQGYSQTEIWDMLALANATAEAPLPMDELASIMAWAVKKAPRGGDEPREMDLSSHFAALEANVKRWKGKRLGFGVRLLDETIGGGLYPGEIMNLVGGPGAMKTSLSLSMAEQEIDRGGRVLYLSLDMPAEEILSRLLLRYAGIGKDRVVSAIRHDDREYEEAKQRLIERMDGRFHVVGNEPMSLRDIDAALSRACPTLVILDYVTLVQAGDSELAVTRNVMQWVRQAAEGGSLMFLLLHQMSKSSLINQKNGLIGNNSMGGSSAQQTAWYEIELLKQENEDGGIAHIVATITKSRRGGDGRSLVLDYVPCRMTFTGDAQLVRQIKKSKPVFEIGGGQT